MYNFPNIHSSIFISFFDILKIYYTKAKMMNRAIYQDPSILDILETRFYNDKEKFVEAIKEMFQIKNRLETQEYNLLKSYDRGELSIGQIGTILNMRLWNF